MITVQLKQGDIQIISNNVHFYSSSNHHIGIRTDFPYTLDKYTTKVANLSIPSIRNNSEIITIQKNAVTSNMNPMVVYKSILPKYNASVSLGTSEKPWNRMYISSNSMVIHNQSITINPIQERVVLPSSTSLNVGQSNQHVLYGVPKRYVIPPGVLVPFGGMVNITQSSEEFQPKGYLPCDGRLISIQTYARLFGVLGYNYGGSGSYFAVPDFRERSPYGYDTSIPIQQFKGGSSNITLDSATTMPRHLHNVQYLNGDNPVAEGNYGLIRRSQQNILTTVKPLISGFSNYKWNLTDPPRGSTFVTESSGNVSPEPFSILHPYVLVHFLIKT